MIVVGIKFEEALALGKYLGLQVNPDSLLVFLHKKADCFLLLCC